MTNYIIHKKSYSYDTKKGRKVKKNYLFVRFRDPLTNTRNADRSIDKLHRLVNPDAKGTIRNTAQAALIVELAIEKDFTPLKRNSCYSIGWGISLFLL